MGTSLKPGAMGDKSATGKPVEFINSMAEAMETAFWNLLHNENMQTFEVDTNSQEARDRRRLFVAIAQGVVNHLAQNAGAFQVSGTDSTAKPISAALTIKTS